MTPKEMTAPLTGTLDGTPLAEFRMALIVSMHCWGGTSLVEGAYDVLRQIRAQHKEGREWPVN